MTILIGWLVNQGLLSLILSTSVQRCCHPRTRSRARNLIRLWSYFAEELVRSWFCIVKALNLWKDILYRMILID